MAGQQQIGLAKLKCNGCNASESFVAVYNLVYGDGKGLIMQPAGHQCQQCGAVVDAARLIDQHKLRQKMAEVATLQQEIAESTAPPRPREAVKA